ncbi:MAG: hypothetical protein KC800_34455 [Candidatus Eremiobacteraeota bacterium]|nr:hypothetical protein [Candidatus Eremiobacteraeota bacterium]
MYKHHRLQSRVSALALAVAACLAALTAPGPAHAERVMPSGHERAARVAADVEATEDVTEVVRLLKLRMAAAWAARYDALAGR